MKTNGTKDGRDSVEGIIPAATAPLRAPNPLAKMIESAEASLQKTEETCRAAVQMAHMAFGGHISKGLLRRGRAAKEKIAVVNLKVSRLRLFDEMARLPNMYEHGVSSEQWDTLRECVYKMIVYSDLGDKHDYHGVSRGEYHYPLLEASRHFIDRYANQRVKNLLLPLFNHEPPSPTVPEFLPSSSDIPLPPGKSPTPIPKFIQSTLDLR